MRIQNINMAVPVGRPATPDTATETIEAEVSTEMDALRERCVQTVRQRSRFAFNQRQRTLRQQQLDVELKGIVKKLASAACSDIADRNIRADMRVRLYTDLTTIAQAISTELEELGIRRRRLRKWLYLSVPPTLLAASIGAGVWIIGLA